MGCDRLPCSFIVVALLGSYAVQSQLGDHNPDTHGNTSEYLKSLELSPQQNDELLDKVTELHRTHRSVTLPTSYFIEGDRWDAVDRYSQPSIPSGSVNEYQLRLGRQRQVWFIPLADERGVCR